MSTLIIVQGIRDNIAAKKTAYERALVDLPKQCVNGTISKKEVHDRLNGMKDDIEDLKKQLKLALAQMKRSR